MSCDNNHDPPPPSAADSLPSVSLTVRLTTAMVEQLRLQARHEHRSLSAQIALLVERALQERGR